MAKRTSKKDNTLKAAFIGAIGALIVGLIPVIDSHVTSKKSDVVKNNKNNNDQLVSTKTGQIYDTSIIKQTILSPYQNKPKRSQIMKMPSNEIINSKFYNKIEGDNNKVFQADTLTVGNINN